MVITDIDFKIAPEGATHYSYATGDVDWYKLDCSGWHIWLFGGWGSVDRSMGSCVNEIPVDKPQNEIDLDVSGQLDRLLEGNKAKEKLAKLGYIFHQGEWLSKEEIENKKKNEFVNSLSMEIMNNVKVNDGSVGDYRYDIAVYLYDAGYRKGEL